MTERFIVTAAHCTRNKTADELTVCVGIHHLSDACQQTGQIESIIEHPNYYDSNTKVLNDIALIRLFTPLDLSGRTVKKLSIPQLSVDDFNYPTAGTNVLAIGWGRLATNGPVSNELRQVELKIFDKSASYCRIVSDNPTQVCTFKAHKGKIEQHENRMKHIFQLHT